MNISRLIGGIIVGLAFSSNGNAQEGRAVLYSPSMAVSQEKIANPQLVDDSVLSFDNLEFDDGGEIVSSPQNAKEETKQPPQVPETLIVEEKTEVVQPLLPEKEEKKTAEGQSLTDALKAKEVSAPQEEASSTSETWINKLKQPLTTIGSSLVSGESAKSTLENLINDSQTEKKRSNASVFDISGIMLRMSPLQADEAMKKRGFSKVNQEYDIPNFIRWRNEESCRNNGVVGYERVENCIIEMAKKNNYQYIASTKYVKYKTKEEITVRYSSNFTNNKAYQIIYKSMATDIRSTSAKALYLRNIKIYDFWKLVNQKYGAPDNQEDITWGLGGNKPTLKASTGMLKLEDPMLRELDYTRMSREDQLFMNTNLYSF